MEKWQQLAKATQFLAPRPSYNKLRVQRFLMENILACFIQYGGLYFSTVLDLFSLVWFASGTAAAFTFMRGYRILWGIGLGSFLAYYWAGGSFLLSLSCTFLLLLQASLLRWGCFTYISTSLVFYRLAPFFKFLLFSCGLFAMTSAFLCAVTLTLLPLPFSFFQIFFNWWLANWNGLLIVGSAIVAFNTYFSDLHLFFKTVRNATFNPFKGWCGGVLLACCFMLFFQMAFFFHVFLLKNIVILQMLLVLMTVVSFFIAIQRSAVHYQI